MRGTFALMTTVAALVGCRAPPIRPPTRDVVSCIEHLAHGRCELAEETGRLALEYGPANGEAHNCLGMVELSCRGDLDAAAARFKEALAVDGDFAQAHNNLGVTFFRRVPPDLDTACEEFGAAIEIDPDYLDARMNLGMCLLKQGKAQYPKARSQLLRLLERDPLRADALLALGYMDLDLGKLDDAEDQLKRCLEVEPGHASCCYDLGVVHLEKRRCAPALEAFACAMRDPSRPVELEARRGFGEAQRRCALEDAAVASLLERAKREPGNAALHFDLGRMFAERGLLDGAEEEWARAVKLDPAYCPAHFELAMLAHRNLDGVETVLRCRRFLDCSRASKRPEGDAEGRCLELVRRLYG